MCTEMHMLLDFLTSDILTGQSKFSGDWQQLVLKRLGPNVFHTITSSVILKHNHYAKHFFASKG